MTINKKEILRYLSAGDQPVSAQLNEKIDKMVERVEATVKGKSIYAIKEFSVQEQSVIIEGLPFASKNLAKNLKGCERVVLMAVTLGVESDFIIRQAQSRGATDGAVAQAVLTSKIEEECDALAEIIRIKAAEEGLFPRPRFSPGYGDLGLENQDKFFKILDISRRIGVALSESKIMSPSKSVTAFIGLEKKKEPKKEKETEKCRSCSNRECQFREEENIDEKI